MVVYVVVVDMSWCPPSCCGVQCAAGVMGVISPEQEYVVCVLLATIMNCMLLKLVERSSIRCRCVGVIVLRRRREHELWGYVTSGISEEYIGSGSHVLRRGECWACA